MNEIVCANCFNCLPTQFDSCPGCGANIVLEGENKSVIDRLEPDCLIHRYEGSDMLEAAVLIKEAKTNCKVATRLKEFPNPVNVPKTKVFQFDDKVFSSIQALRNERSATVYRYDQQIESHFKKLKPYDKK